MKKYVLSTLCSALVIPGLGQIINRNLKKGLIILGAIFVLFVGATVKLAFIISSLSRQPRPVRNGTQDIMERLQGEDLSSLWLLAVAFAIIWIYSVMDAFWVGRKMGGEEDAPR
jgi:hypothetical protein